MIRSSTCSARYYTFRTYRADEDRPQYLCRPHEHPSASMLKKTQRFYRVISTIRPTGISCRHSVTYAARDTRKSSNIFANGSDNYKVSQDGTLPYQYELSLAEMHRRASWWDVRDGSYALQHILVKPGFIFIVTQASFRWSVRPTASGRKPCLRAAYRSSPRRHIQHRLVIIRLSPASRWPRRTFTNMPGCWPSSSPPRNHAVTGRSPDT